MLKTKAWVLIFLLNSLVFSEPIIETELNNINSLNQENNCICFDKQVSSATVANLLDPNYEGLQRIVVYLYRTERNNNVYMYIPNKVKQQLTPDLVLEDTDILLPVINDQIDAIFQNNSNSIYLHPVLPSTLTDPSNVNNNSDHDNTNKDYLALPEISNEAPTHTDQTCNKTKTNDDILFAIYTAINNSDQSTNDKSTSVSSPEETNSAINLPKLFTSNNGKDISDGDKLTMPSSSENTYSPTRYSEWIPGMKRREFISETRHQWYQRNYYPEWVPSSDNIIFKGSQASSSDLYPVTENRSVLNPSISTTNLSSQNSNSRRNYLPPIPSSNDENITLPTNDSNWISTYNDEITGLETNILDQNRLTDNLSNLDQSTIPPLQKHPPTSSTNWLLLTNNNNTESHSTFDSLPLPEIESSLVHFSETNFYPTKSAPNPTQTNYISNTNYEANPSAINQKRILLASSDPLDNYAYNYSSNNLNQPSLSLIPSVNQMPAEEIKSLTNWILGEIMSIELKSINITKLEEKVTDVLSDHGITIDSNGNLVSSNGEIFSISNLRLRPVYVGDDIEYQKVLSLKGKQDHIPRNLHYVKLLIVSLYNTEEVLGVIPIDILENPITTQNPRIESNSPQYIEIEITTKATENIQLTTPNPVAIQNLDDSNDFLNPNLILEYNSPSQALKSVDYNPPMFVYPEELKYIPEENHNLEENKEVQNQTPNLLSSNDQKINLVLTGKLRAERNINGDNNITPKTNEVSTISPKWYKNVIDAIRARGKSILNRSIKLLGVENTSEKEHISEKYQNDIDQPEIQRLEVYDVPNVNVNLIKAYGVPENNAITENLNVKRSSLTNEEDADTPGETIAQKITFLPPIDDKPKKINTNVGSPKSESFYQDDDQPRAKKWVKRSKYKRKQKYKKYPDLTGFYSENSYPFEDPDFRIIGGAAATFSGLPISNRGRAGYIAV